MALYKLQFSTSITVVMYRTGELMHIRLNRKFVGYPSKGLEVSERIERVTRVLVELVPTFSFAMCFTRGTHFSNTPAAVSDTQHTRCSCLGCVIYVWGVYCRARLGVVFLRARM